jgi:peptidoglycan/LPS O-acetylase OafA/YrhL
MKRVPQLDSARGLAVLVVLLHNTDKFQYAGFVTRNGWMGVDLFFVLSGFLITGVLLESKDTNGYFQNFYARRCLRIWPLYYCALLFMFIFVPWLRPTEAHTIFAPRSMPWWSYFVYLQNFVVPAITRATGLLGVTWSLAVEEQFYAVWPLFVRFCSEAQLRNVTITVLCLSPILRFFLVHRGFDVYPNTFCRLDGLMAGALMAVVFRSNTFSREKYVRLAWIALLITSPLAMITAGRVPWAVYSFTALASVSFVYLALCSKQKWLQALMGNRFLIYTGVISYGIYLLEKIPADAAMSLHFNRHPAFLRLKRFFEVEGSTPRNPQPALSPAP